MKHFASPAFWEAYEKLPDQVRALAIEIPDGLLRFWIGTHKDYDAIIVYCRKQS